MIRWTKEGRTQIAKRLCELRIARGLTQSELGDRVGLAFTYISRLECGHVVPSLALLEKLAKGLEVEVYQFFLDRHPKPEVPELFPDGAQEWSLLHVFRELSPKDRSLLLFMARQFAGRASERLRANTTEQIHTQSEAPTSGRFHPTDAGEAVGEPRLNPAAQARPTENDGPAAGLSHAPEQDAESPPPETLDIERRISFRKANGPKRRPGRPRREERK